MSIFIQKTFIQQPQMQNKRQSARQFCSLKMTVHLWDSHKTSVKKFLEKILSIGFILRSEDEIMSH